MGDFNCPVHSQEVDLLLTRTHLCEPLDRLNTFPGWRPVRDIDHILTSPSLRIVPEGVQLAA